MLVPTGTLDDLVPEARPHFEQLLALAESMGLSPVVRGVGRTCADQAKLAASGPSTTHANLCRSWHVLGRAVDLTLSPDTCAAYTTLGQAWEQMGGIWGGRFSGFGPCGDAGHFQWAPAAAVPEETCPEAITLEACEELRAKYLQAHQQTRLPWAFFLIGAAAVGGWLWWRR